MGKLSHPVAGGDMLGIGIFLNKHINKLTSKSAEQVAEMEGKSRFNDYEELPKWVNHLHWCFGVFVSVINHYV